MCELLWSVVISAGDLAGRLSTLWRLSTIADESWFYNGLALPAHHYHARASGQVPFVVSYDYDAGLPVQEYANGIPVVTAVTYQPSGALASYTTGAGIGHNVTTSVGQDPSLLPRPSSITTTGATAHFATGSYSYDGVGNIMAMGSDQFVYDSRSRLTSASLFGSGSQNFTKRIRGRC